jgi:hypothetical protein
MYISVKDTQYSILRLTPGLAFFFFFSFIVCLSFYTAYIAFIPKRIVFDGYFLFYYRKNTLKKKIVFKDIYQINSGFYWLPKRGPIYRVNIRYHIAGTKEILTFRGDEFTKHELKQIFRTIAHFARHNNIYIVDRNKWLT